MTTVMNVVGARPQFVKAGPVSKAMAVSGLKEVLVHTGQHYDDLMSDSIMSDVGLRDPDIDLGVGSASHGVQTARMLERLERAIQELAPQAVLTYGDTNSTVAAALAASKLGIFTAHVEAGLRSFNRSMPEELNRVATDHLSDFLFAPTITAAENLKREGLADRCVLSGDVMVDALQSIDLDMVRPPDWALGEFYSATLHRPSNTDDAHRLQSIMDAFGRLQHPLHLLAHPRLQKFMRKFSTRIPPLVRVHEPLPYSEMLKVLSLSQGLLTDSGGLQKEAFILRVRCTTIRSETEWPETLEGSWNVLAGDRLHQLPELAGRATAETRSTPFGDGRASQRIVEELLDRL